MAIVYEHWRPDLDECFYVGASYVGGSRAETFYRENDDYLSVLYILKMKGLEPYYKVVWDNIPEIGKTRKEKSLIVGAYEKIRIAYWRGLIGKRLTNICVGGEGINVEWSDELRAKVGLSGKIRWETASKDDREKWSEATALNGRHWWKKLTDEERAEHSRKITEAHAKRSSEERSATIKNRWNRADAEERKDHGKRMSSIWHSQTPEQKAARIQAMVAGNAKRSFEDRQRSARKSAETAKLRKANESRD